MSRVIVHGFNPNRDKLGRFVSKGGGSSTTKSKTSTTSNPKNMSDAELSAFIRRKNLENTYDKLNKNSTPNKLDKAKKIVDTTSTAVKQLDKLNKDTTPKPERKKMDLSGMSDQELRERINRINLEKQYNDLFGEIQYPTISKGQRFLNNVLDTAGSTLTVGASAITIALAVKELKK